MGAAIFGNAVVGRVSTELPGYLPERCQSYPESYPARVGAGPPRWLTPRATPRLPGTVLASPAASALTSANLAPAGTATYSTRVRENRVSQVQIPLSILTDSSESWSGGIVTAPAFSLSPAARSPSTLYNVCAIRFEV